MIIKNKLSRFMSAILLAGVLLSLPAAYGCNNVTDDPNDDSGDDEFTGSITDGDKKDDTTDDNVDEGDENQTYYISTAEEFRKIKRKGTYILTADIDLSGEEWKPIGTYASPFVGTLDGNGHTVSGLKISTLTKDSGVCLSYEYTYLGLFGCTQNATVKNITLSEMEISADTSNTFRVIYAGAVSGYSTKSSFEACTVNSGSITASSKRFKASAGGIVGFSFSSDFKLCNSSATVSVTDSEISSYVGGIVGHLGSDSSVYGCVSSGTLYSNSSKGNSYCGGISGYLSNSVIRKCVSEATVTAETTCDESELGKLGAAFAGGITAFSGGTGVSNDEDDKDESEKTAETEEVRTVSDIINSYSNGAVTARSTDYVAYAGGITGTHSFTNITNSYSSANITATSSHRDVYVGGIAAYCGSYSAHTGVFFSGSLTASAKNATAKLGVIVGSNGNTDEKDPNKFEKCGYLELSAMSISSIDSSSEAKPLIHGEDYTAAELRSKTIVISSFGWSDADWSFSMISYPSIKLD